MITKHAANIFSSIWNGAQKAGSGVGTALGSAAAVGFPVYQYMSGDDSMGGAAGGVAGMAAGTVAGRTLSKPVGDAINKAGDRLIARGASLGGKGKILGTAGGLALKGVGKLTNLFSKVPKTVGTLGGGTFGFEAGRNIGNKYVPIHKRDPMPQVKQASAVNIAKPILSPLWKKRIKWTGGIAGTGLAAYYGNKNFNEKREELSAIPQYQPLYPQQFYNAKQ